MSSTKSPMVRLTSALACLPEQGVQWLKGGTLGTTFLHNAHTEEGSRQTLRRRKGQSVKKRQALPILTIAKKAATAILNQELGDNGMSARPSATTHHE